MHWWHHVASHLDQSVGARIDLECCHLHQLDPHHQQQPVYAESIIACVTSRLLLVESTPNGLNQFQIGVHFESIHE